MATNKRKDSAALFELIDKSTLKVPKHSGSLKIPSWWSSKSNPPALSQPPHATSANGHATSTNPQPNAFQKPVPPVAPQSRMFEPPPSDLSGTPSPSIRPPVPPSGPRFAMVTAASEANRPAPPSNGDADNATAVMDTHEIPDESPTDSPANGGATTEAYAGLGAGRRVFAPQTMSQTDGIQRDWNQKSRLARAPMWAIVAAVSAVVIVLVLIVYALMSLHSSPTAKPASPPSAGSPLTGPNAHVTLPTPQNPNITTPAPTHIDNHQNLLNTATTPTSPTAPTAPTPAHAYDPGTVARNADLYYIIIATTPTAGIAQRNADFLAKNGIDVSIETQMSRTNHMLYKLISVKGFTTITDAHDLQKRIVDIGQLPPYFSKARPAWNDASVTRWSALVGAAPHH